VLNSGVALAKATHGDEWWCSYYPSYSIKISRVCNTNNNNIKFAEKNETKKSHRSEALLASVVGTGLCGRGEKGFVVIGLTLLPPGGRPTLTITPHTHISTRTPRPRLEYFVPAESGTNKRLPLKTERSAGWSLIYYLYEYRFYNPPLQWPTTSTLGQIHPRWCVKYYYLIFSTTTIILWYIFYMRMRKTMTKTVW